MGKLEWALLNLIWLNFVNLFQTIFSENINPLQQRFFSEHKYADHFKIQIVFIRTFNSCNIVQCLFIAISNGLFLHVNGIHSDAFGMIVYTYLRVCCFIYHYKHKLLFLLLLFALFLTSIPGPLPKWKSLVLHLFSWWMALILRHWHHYHISTNLLVYY